MALGNCFDKKIETCFMDGEFDVIHVHHPVLVGQTALYLGKNIASASGSPKRNFQRRTSHSG